MKKELKMSMQKGSFLPEANTGRSALYIWASAISLGLSIFQSGYAITVIGTLENQITSNFNWQGIEATDNFSIVASMFPFGNLIGPFISIKLMNSIGRLKTLLVTNLISTVGIILQVIINYPILLAGRFLLGFSYGMIIALVPVFIKEITPTEMSGSIGSLTGIMLAIGQMGGYIGGIFVDMPVDVNEFSWRGIALATLVTNLIQLILIPTVIKSDSPRYYYLVKRDENLTRNRLKTIYQDSFIDDQLSELQREKRSFGSSGDWKGLFRNFWKQFLVGSSVIVLMQLSGNTAIFTFADEIFEKSGLKNSRDCNTYSTMMGLSSVVSSLIMIYLLDRLGRKKIFMMSLFLLALILIVVATSIQYGDYLLARWMMIVYTFFWMPLGSIAFMYQPEILPPSLVNLVIFVNASASLGVTFSFLHILNSPIGIVGAFFIYAGCCLGGIIFCYFFMKETKGKQFTEIMDEFNGTQTLMFVEEEQPESDTSEDSLHKKSNLKTPFLATSQKS
jgi:MFS family permease